MSIREKRIEQALELYAEGYNASEIGRRLHVNHTTIIEWLKERGVYRAVRFQSVYMGNTDMP